MCKYIDNLLIACKPCARLVAGFVTYMLALVLSDSVHAAGCSHHPEQRMEGARDGIAVVYENGRFYYHNIVPPCSGPSCDRSKPTTLNALPSAVMNERNTTQSFLTADHIFDITRPSAFRFEMQSHYRSPFFEEPLRPPV